MTECESLAVIPEDNKLSIISPNAPLEAELLKQLQKVGEASEYCFNRALAERGNLHSQNIYLNLGSKLTRSYTALVAALSRCRGGGTEQKIIVEHLHLTQNGGG